jgi:hypothetical protein
MAERGLMAHDLQRERATEWLLSHATDCFDAFVGSF